MNCRNAQFLQQIILFFYGFGARSAVRFPVSLGISLRYVGSASGRTYKTGRVIFFAKSRQKLTHNQLAASCTRLREERQRTVSAIRDALLFYKGNSFQTLGTFRAF
jgi:hypothetical protein